MSLKLLLQYLLPNHPLSRLAAKIANCRIPIIKNFIIGQYCKYYHIDLQDALEPNYLNYPTFNDFFTRALGPEARPIASDQKIIISPVDGSVGQIGKVVNQQLINAKGRGFTLEQLLANSQEAEKFHHANFVVLYLAPDNYHRIHMPILGRLSSMSYLPGKLFSVNPKVVSQIPDLFAKNERVMVMFDTILGRVAIILVGAMVVGSIETRWAGLITPNREKNIMNWDYSTQNLTFERGSEIARFKLGSTVILLFPDSSIEWDQTLQPNTPIKMGESLGRIL